MSSERRQDLIFPPAPERWLEELPGDVQEESAVRPTGERRLVAEVRKRRTDDDALLALLARLPPHRRRIGRQVAARELGRARAGGLCDRAFGSRAARFAGQSAPAAPAPAPGLRVRYDLCRARALEEAVAGLLRAPQPDG